MSDPFRRIPGIDRQICAAAFNTASNATTMSTDAPSPPRPPTPAPPRADQKPRQPIRPRVQLRIRQLTSSNTTATASGVAPPAPRTAPADGPAAPPAAVSFHSDSTAGARPDPARRSGQRPGSAMTARAPAPAAGDVLDRHPVEQVRRERTGPAPAGVPSGSKTSPSRRTGRTSRVRPASSVTSADRAGRGPPGRCSAG